MTDLARLVDEGRRLVSEDLMRGKVHRPRIEDQVALVEPLARAVDLAPFDEAIDHLLETSDRFDARLDANAAPAIHAALPLTRREAADPGIWRYLAVVRRPDFVRHRWEYRTRATMVGRFWSYGTRHDSNTLCRLWWIAELTASDGDYALTERALASQTIAIALFTRELGAYRPVVEAFIDVFGKSPSEEVERAMKRLSAWLSTVPIEGRSTAELRTILESIRDGRA